MTTFLLIVAGGALKLEGEDSLGFSKKLEKFLKENSEALGVEGVNREGVTLFFRLSSLNVHLEPSLLKAELEAESGQEGPGLNWLTLFAFFRVKDEYKRGEGAAAVAGWVNDVNSTFNFCTFFLDEDGDLGVKASLPFDEELSLGELRGFFQTFVAATLATIVSSGSEFVE